MKQRPTRCDPVTQQVKKRAMRFGSLQQSQGHAAAISDWHKLSKIRHLCACQGAAVSK